jgi:hypothetical protein
MRMGRPTKLTPEIQERIVGLIRDGNAGETAAEAVGVRAATFYEWLARGEGTHSRDDPDGIYADFADAVTLARADAEVVAVKCLRRGMDTDPRLSVEWLKRARFKLWDPKPETEVHAHVTMPKIEIVYGGENRSQQVPGSDPSPPGVRAK